MGEIASSGQLRMGYLRWALLTVPLLLFLGFVSARIGNNGYGNRWFDALDKPPAMPPAWAFPVVWTILYVLMGLALAMVLNARGARYRSYAVAMFVAQFAINLAWSPLFFAAHQVTAALVLIVSLFIAALGTTLIFSRVRPVAAWLMVPYLAWIVVAGILNWQVMVRNPNAERLVPERPSTQIRVR